MGKEHSPRYVSNVSGFMKSIGCDPNKGCRITDPFHGYPPTTQSEFRYENTRSETQSERMNRCDRERQTKDIMGVGPKGADDIAMQTHMKHLREQYECSSGKK